MEESHAEDPIEREGGRRRGASSSRSSKIAAAVPLSGRPSAAASFARARGRAMRRFPTRAPAARSPRRRGGSPCARDRRRRDAREDRQRRAARAGEAREQASQALRFPHFRHRRPHARHHMPTIQIEVGARECELAIGDRLADRALPRGLDREVHRDASPTRSRRRRIEAVEGGPKPIVGLGISEAVVPLARAASTRARATAISGLKRRAARRSAAKSQLSRAGSGREAAPSSSEGSPRTRERNSASRAAGAMGDGWYATQATPSAAAAAAAARRDDPMAARCLISAGSPTPARARTDCWSSAFLGFGGGAATAPSPLRPATKGPLPATVTSPR